MDVKKKLVELIGKVQDEGVDYTLDIPAYISNDILANYLIANGVTVQGKKEKPPVDLTGKCGSCAYAEKAIGHFGKSQCYVECTNKEHLSGRMYQERPLVAVRQRTAKACKKYTPQTPKGE